MHDSSRIRTEGYSVANQSANPLLIQGVGDDFVSDVPDLNLVDIVLTASDNGAVETTRPLSREEGLTVQTSSRARVFAALNINNGRKRVVTVLPNRAEQHFSTTLLWCR